MPILLKENKKIIIDYLSKKTSREYENYTKKVMSIQKDIEKGKNVEKNKAALRKLEEGAEKKWGAKKARHEYMLVAKNCIKFYAQLEKNPNGMTYQDYQKLKRYTDILADKTMIDKIKESMTDDVKRRTFKFVTNHFKEMSGIVNNWEKCHGKDLEKAFPLKTADFEKGKYSEMRDNVLDLEKLWTQMGIIKRKFERYTNLKDPSHTNSKEFNNMHKAIDKFIKDLGELMDERNERQYELHEGLVQEDSNKLYNSIQAAKKEMRKYIEAKGGLENQRTLGGISRINTTMVLFKEIEIVENMCITTQSIRDKQQVWNALSLKNPSPEKAPDPILSNV